MIGRAPTLLRASANAARFSQSVTFVARKHTLPELGYAYDALEPAISAEIMELHHSKHHQTYVTGLNNAEEQLAQALQAGDTQKQIALQAALKFNGGGHINHSLFWKNLAPLKDGGGELPSESTLAKAIQRDFGSYDQFKEKLTAAALGIQGSGWAWLSYNKANSRLQIETTANQDPLTSTVPILGAHHAFYLQHQNKKPPYLENVFKVLNFGEANKRLEAAS